MRLLCAEALGQHFHGLPRGALHLGVQAQHQVLRQLFGLLPGFVHQFVAVFFIETAAEDFIDDIGDDDWQQFAPLLVIERHVADVYHILATRHLQTESPSPRVR